MENSNITLLKLGNLNVEILDLCLLHVRNSISEFNHAHSFCEIHFVLNGYVEINVGGEAVRIEKGKMLFLSRNSSHFCINKSEDFETCSFCFNLSFNGRGEEKLVHEYGYFTKLFSKRKFAILDFNAYDRGLLSNILSNQNTFTIYSVYKINTEITNLFLEIGNKLSKFLSDSEKNEPSSISNDHNSLRKNHIEYYMSNHVHNGSIEDLAKYLHLSVRQTSRFLKKFFGKTFREVLNETRIRYAEPLVREGKLSLKEIAKNSGFKSFEQFYVSYSEHFGKPPKTNLK